MSRTYVWLDFGGGVASPKARNDEISEFYWAKFDENRRDVGICYKIQRLLSWGRCAFSKLVRGVPGRELSFFDSRVTCISVP